MKSCIYECTILHSRIEPKKTKFSYSYIMFYLDLDEIETLTKRFLFFSRNRFNLFSFQDKKHLGHVMSYFEPKKTKEKILDFLEAQGIKGCASVRLLAKPTALGYHFNPVTFYYCFDENNEPLCSVVAITDRNGEQLPYLINGDHLKGNRFYTDTPRKEYLPNLLDNNVQSHFNLGIPDKRITIKIDDYDWIGKKSFVSTILGNKVQLSDLNLLWYNIWFPYFFIKVKSIMLRQTIKLWFKKLSYRGQLEHPDLLGEWYKPIGRD